jgi:hypothetical protein
MSNEKKNYISIPEFRGRKVGDKKIERFRDKEVEVRITEIRLLENGEVMINEVINEVK